MFEILRRSRTAMIPVCLLLAGAAAVAADRAPAQVLKDLDAAPMPPIDPARQSEPGYLDRVRQELLDVGARRDKLILELFAADPDNTRLPELMTERWRRHPPISPAAAKTLEQEIATVLAGTRNVQLKAEALFARAQIGLLRTQQSGTTDLAGVEEFVRAYPRDGRAPLLLYAAATVVRDPKFKRSLEDRVLKDYPQSQFVPAIQGIRRQMAAIGKPFELEFNDVISGSKVSMKDLKGKVVVIDFWATWCTPCIGELPHMKELYATYRDKGVEFIGISLDQPKDQGGLDRLKDFVKKNEIRWPQFYLGHSWESDFVRDWGINAIPAVFLVDTAGNLASVEGRGQLDRMIPELLAKKGGARRSSGGE